TDRAFAARRHTELNGLCLNAVPLGDSLNCHGFQAVVSVRKTPSEAACRRQDLSRVSHAPVVFLGRGTPRSASLHVGLHACHRLRRFGLGKPKSFPKSLRPSRSLRFPSTSK